MKRNLSFAAASMAFFASICAANATEVIGGFFTGANLSLVAADGLDNATYEDIGNFDSEFTSAQDGAWGGTSGSSAPSSGAGLLADLVGVQRSVWTGDTQETRANAEAPEAEAFEAERRRVSLFIVRNPDDVPATLDFVLGDESLLIYGIETSLTKRGGFSVFTRSRVEEVDPSDQVLDLLAETTLGPISEVREPGGPDVPFTNNIGPAPSVPFSVTVDPFGELRLRLSTYGSASLFSDPAFPEASEIPLAPSGLMLLAGAGAFGALRRRRRDA